MWLASIHKMGKEGGDRERDAVNVKRERSKRDFFFI